MPHQAETEKNKALVIQITQAKNENNIAKLKEFFAADFIAHISDWPEPMNREEYLAAVELSHKAFSPLIFTIEEMITEGDKIAVRILATGKHTGVYEHFQATQHDIEFRGMLMRRIINGKVVEEWQVNDHLTMLKQMGLSVNHII